MTNLLSGSAYLESLKAEYPAYIQFLSTISDSALEYQKQLNAKREIGVESFLADFALGFEDRRRNLVRWKTGEKLPKAGPEKLDLIAKVLPKFVVFNTEAAGGMNITSVRRHKIDLVVEEIMYEVAKRLPRTIDSYRFHQDYAKDTINVPGIGEIEVCLSETGNGIFKSVNSITTKEFNIWNCRDSGVSYLNRYTEISRPARIKINSQDLELSIYSDGSGEESSNPRKFASDQDIAIIWLVDYVLNKIKVAPLPKSQISVPDMDIPYPEGLVGPLYAFVKEENLEKVQVLQQSSLENAYPDERDAANPSYRLIPLGNGTKGQPEIVHDGYIWCGIGKVDEVAKQDPPYIADRQIDNYSIFSREGIAEIKPLTATDVYIIDWQAWDDYRNKTFTDTHDRLNGTEVCEMYDAVAKTLIPITEYRGDYRQPVVMISRSLEVSEIGKSYIFPRQR